MVYNMAPFPYPKIVELREKYTYNIHPLANNISPEKKVKPKAKDAYISSDDEDDDVNQLNIGCLGLLSPQAALEGSAQKVRHSEGPSYQFPMDFSKAAKGSANTARRSRPPVGVSDLEKEYNRTRKLQQQAVVVFSQGNTSKSQDLREIPPAINHLFVVTHARRNKWKEHLQKERQRQERLFPLREEEEDRERGHVENHVNEHVTDAAEHLVGLFKGAAADDSPTGDQDREFEGSLGANLDMAQSSTNQKLSSRASKSSKDTNNFKVVKSSNPSNNLKLAKDPSLRKAAKTSLSIPPVDPSLVLPDKKCIYPAKFSPFPGTRTKVSKNGLLYGKRTETEAPKKQSFISGPPMPYQARTNR